MVLTFLAVILLFGFVGSPVWADELSDAVEMVQQREWQKCLPLAQAAVKARPWNERAWHSLLASQIGVGDYCGAASTFDEGYRRFPSSLRLRLTGRVALRMCGETKRADDLFNQIDALVKQAPWRYTDAYNRVLLGKYYLEGNADARQVLEVFYDQAKRSMPQAAEPHIAAGELALVKGDFELAASSFQEAIKRNSERPDAVLGLSQAFHQSDRDRANALLGQVLEKWPRHVPSLLELAERQIDGELYEDAKATIEKIHDINPEYPQAWALLAVIANLQGNDPQYQFLRTLALGWWAKDPEVDHLIGRKLSQHYRFTEGAALQRNVLELKPDHTAAKLQLSQDLLRLGREEEGWKLVNESLEQDGYSVLAHNLVALQKELARFTSIENEDFIVRMDAEEAAVYGDQVLQLLENARTVLCEKYHHQLRGPVIVEIFPRQADFAIRTFGMPGGEGFLGVCFGSVITANSPASQGDSPSNWASVLWHEFCHVVTLQKTNNRMPRWLSEGISVYEERQRRRGWGQTMTPRYRQMILGGELTPVSQLSNAFLKPPSPMHLQFAYYESSMVVEYLIEKYGLAPLVRVLNELGEGMPINDALARTAGSIEALDRGFAAYAKQRAEALAPKADWSEMPPEVEEDAELRDQWLADHPDSLAARRQEVQRRLNAKRWKEAEAALLELAEWFPEESGAGGVRSSLARVYRELNDAASEKKVLRELLELQGDALSAGMRLLELSEAEQDWETACWAGERVCEINPLQRGLQRRLAAAAQAAGKAEVAIAALSALLTLGPADPAATHYQLATALTDVGDSATAKRQVLKALEEAPRYLAAQKLLLELVAHEKKIQNRKSSPAMLLPPLEELLPPLEEPSAN